MLTVRGIALAANADKSLELIATSADETGSPDPVWHAWQGTPAGYWSDWQPLADEEPASGEWGDGPAVARAANNCLEAVVVGNNRGLWHATQPDPGAVDWNGWVSLKQPGGQKVVSGHWDARPAIATPALARNANGRLEVFVVRNDRTVWHRWQSDTGDWLKWESLLQPGEEGTLGPLAVGTNADGRLEVFAPDIHGAIWHRWQRAEDDPDLSGGGWKPPRSWYPLSPHGSPSADHGPVVARNADRRLELFIVADGAVWYRAQRPDVDWFDWRSLGSVGSNLIDIGVGARADRRLVLVAATEGQLFYQEQQPKNRWPGQWRRFPHRLPTGSTGPLGMGTVKLASNGDGGLELFLLLSTGRICEFRRAPNGAWSEATLWSPPKVGAPTVPEQQY
jgi:hypothetical protein